MAGLVKILCADLELGMHVASLDRPWLETSFVLQGFDIETEEEIERLRSSCKFVYIDCSLSKLNETVIRRKVHSRPRTAIQDLFPRKTLKPYQDTASWEEEYPRAQAAVQGLSECIDHLLDNADKGAKLDISRIKLSVDPVIGSITRNPDACIWLARMKQEDQYAYQHPLGASIWAVALGRQLGLPKSDLRSLAIGALLFDMGKLQLDSGLLSLERTLTPDEFERVKEHVSLGVEAIKSSGVINQDVIDMVECHHERHDGSGYPRGLSGNAIPVFARVAAIVDCYDAITSHRSYARAIPPSLAIRKINEWKDIDFQAELVEEFVQAIGIYPAGTLVELSSGEIAVVAAEYRTRRLRPKVTVLLDADKKPLAEVRTVDLRTERDSTGERLLEIVDSLEPDAYGIDMTAIQL